MKNIDDYTIGELKEIIQQREENWKEQAKGNWFVGFDKFCGGTFRVFADSLDEERIFRDTYKEYLNGYSRKSDAELFAKKVDLFNRMNLFALIHNEGWKADWKDNDQKKWGVCYLGSFRIDCNYFYHLDFLFGISVKSKEIAKAMLEEFKDELEIYLK